MEECVRLWNAYKKAAGELPQLERMATPGAPESAKIVQTRKTKEENYEKWERKCQDVRFVVNGQVVTVGN